MEHEKDCGDVDDCSNSGLVTSVADLPAENSSKDAPTEQVERVMDAPPPLSEEVIKMMITVALRMTLQ